MCVNMHVKSDFTITEANTFTIAELFPLFQTFLAAKRLYERLAEREASLQIVRPRLKTGLINS